ncbi:NAD-dependent epimerase/dehydratase family protein [Arthrobacter yangruifuii]|uniref:NAD-dependent epimerase/dehydratase family protein n=1 Tax=Arthrobacter yangruifuii TaxID=2606616 RepID=A0A5N6ME33_9MICC|nr:NAD-dependent epimerase/dehydratase family protein [Arthrobacter yangruifuii]KAD3436353.1 NAD-dependent epimerase/dehydratase family protein [Arthrobacter yangruifuii]
MNHTSSAPDSSVPSPASSPEQAPGSSPVWAVLGASGFIGSAICSALAERGVTVRQVSAPRLSAEGTDAAALIAAAAALDGERRRLADAFDGADVVVNAAGLATPGATDSPKLRGANALLPALAADAADAAGVRRLVHLSSAAVQGHRPFLDETGHVEPFSAYSRSKALGEQVLSARDGGSCSVATVRATSVQGPGRATTAKLARLAASPLASVAGSGSAPSPVSSVHSLVDFVVRVGFHQGPVPAVVLQPWERASVSAVLEAAGGRRPARLPAWFCRTVLRGGYALSSLAGERLHGSLRRVEMMWFGQRQEPGWAESTGNVPEPRVREVLEASRT